MRRGMRCQVSPGARSGVLPRLQIHSTLCCRRGETMSARARTAAGSRKRGRPRAVPEVFCENHLRGVSMCACSKKDGSALSAKRRHCAMVQLGLTRAREQNHSFTSGGMCVLRRFVQGSASTIASCIASTIASCRWLVASRFCCHARDALLHGNMVCDCGHRAASIAHVAATLVDLAPPLQHRGPWRR